MLLWVLDPAFSGQLHSHLFSISIPPMLQSGIFTPAPHVPHTHFASLTLLRLLSFLLCLVPQPYPNQQHLTNANWTIHSLESEFRESRFKKNNRRLGSEDGGWRLEQCQNESQGLRRGLSQTFASSMHSWRKILEKYPPGQKTWNTLFCVSLC